MSIQKQLGIWMDHSIAHIIEFTVDSIETSYIESKFTHTAKEQSLEKSEHIMHNKEHQQQFAYYKELGELIKNYGEVILFGPTDAKVELYNILKNNQQYKKIKIEVQQADKMTESQEHAFVKKYFQKHL
jgi:hypothetical protein